MSPTKSSSNAGTPYSTRSPLTLSMQDDITKYPLDPLQLAANPNTRIDGSLPVSKVSPNLDGLEHEASTQSLLQIPPMPTGSSNLASSTASKSKRMGTLSWQQRHPSTAFTKARSRALSAVSTDNGATEGTNSDSSPLVEEPLSRDQVAQTLLSKDTTWFRQTEDRGFGSAGYRRNKDENGSEATTSNGRIRLPGLSRDTSLEPETHSGPPSEPIHSSPLMDASVRTESRGTNRYSSLAPRSSGGIVLSPLPILSSQILQPILSNPSSYIGEERSAVTRTPAMSPSQGRISPERLERPHSPTKGLGGFVQSAMLKRSDSVNKRWSTQAATGLTRGNSVVNSRNGNESPRQATSGNGTFKEFKPTSSSCETSPLTTSRPGSSNNAATVTIPILRAEINASKRSSLTSYRTEPNFGNEPVESGSPSVKAPSLIRDQDGNSAEFANKPASPSKRWSPTKASWLEKALNKPESAKARIVPPQQPSWMMDITKAKQQRGSVDLGKGGASKEVVDLVRSPSPGILCQPQSVEAPQRSFESEVAAKTRGQILNQIDSVRSIEQQFAAEDIVKDGVLDEDGVAMKHTAETKNQVERDRSPSVPISFQLSTTEEDPPSLERGLLPSPKPNSPPPSAPSIEGLQARSRLVSTSDMKPKPQTPPNKDFRSGLKTRPISDGRQNREEAEFKNVFGKLKRTQTQNYVAPDELKENILRGKAGLAATGGPQKTERRDELRESILRQKEAMKMGAPPGIPKKPRGISVLQNQDSPLPEAITKRLGLIKSESGSTSASANTQEEVERVSMAKPGGGAEVKPLRVKLKPTVPEKQQTTTNKTQTVLFANSKPGDPFSSSLAGLLKRGPSPSVSVVKPDGTRNPSVLIGNTISESSADERSISGHPLTHITKSRAKGPKRRLPQQSAKLHVMIDEIPSKSIRNQQPSGAEMIPQNPTPEETSPSSLTFNKLETRPQPSFSNNNQRPSQPLSQRRASAETSLLKKYRLSPPNARLEVKESRSAQSRTPTPVKQTRDSNPKNEQTINLSISESAHRRSISPATDLFRKAPITTGEKIQPPQPPEKESSTELAKGQTYELKKSPSPSLSSATSARSPVISPSRKDDEPSLGGKGLNSFGGQVEPVGLGIQTGINDSTIEAPPKSNLPSPPRGSLGSAKLPKSPPLPGKKPRSISSRLPSIARPTQEIKAPQICQIRERSQILASFFEESGSPKPKITVDTQSVLASRQKDDCPDKIKTLRKQTYLMTGGGKLMPVPSHQEHILFEENLYLCIHVFGAAGGSTTAEVYLWVGDGVAQSAAEDAHLFARKVAREQNGKFITLRQGNETSKFFQALGGIVITRRGPGSRAESPSRTFATYMLCGRSHAGQIAFDEVDFDARSLCSGFPFIVSARFGKLYLWKGLGSGADELGCARLIGMDLGLTGEIEEVDEGSEPETFWESLPGGKPRCIPMAEDGAPHHWHLKPSCDKYSIRLFSVDVEPSRPKSSSSSFIWGRRGSTPQQESTDFNAQIRELFPFTQKDIERDGFFVLDSFFEIFL